MFKRTVKHNKKIIFSAGIIVLAFVLFNIRFWWWKSTLKSSEHPILTVVLNEKGYRFMGYPNGAGNDDSAFYVYFWVVKSSLNIESLSEKYTEIIDKSNENCTGIAAYVQVFPVASYLKAFEKGMPPGNDVIKNLIDPINSVVANYGTEDIFLILVEKPGRLEFLN